MPLEEQAEQLKDQTLGRLLELVDLKGRHKSLQAFKQHGKSGLELGLESCEHLHLLLVHDLVQSKIEASLHCSLEKGHGYLLVAWVAHVEVTNDGETLLHQIDHNLQVVHLLASYISKQKLDD